MRFRRLLATTAMIMACLALSVLAQASTDWFTFGGGGKDVPYVPTTPEVVAKMLELGEVGPDDVLYDLGSGDGRIVIAAARERGAKAVGIDIDDELVRESRENARQAGVSDRAAFQEGDLFEADLSEATVVTMYLLQAVNLQLRPKLLSELKPGARIVSHAFDLGEWEPDATEYVGASVVYAWIVPANVSGTWRMEGGDSSASGPELRLSQEFQQVSGSLNNGGREQSVRDVSLVGRELTFTADVPSGGGQQAMLFRGAAHGNVLEGTATPMDGGQGQPWRATREPGTAMSIDGGEGE